mgnify:CR=1 FL=1
MLHIAIITYIIFIEYLVITFVILVESVTDFKIDAFGQFDWNPTERLNVIAGLRFDYFSDSNVRHLSPHLGMMYKIGNCSLRGSYSQGFRSPTLKEMYMVFNMANMMMIYGNPDLKSDNREGNRLRQSTYVFH